jgi:hypothetical protein
VNVTLEDDPEDGTLPDPLHPVHTYWIPEPPDTGDVTEAVTLDPASNHPLDGVGLSYAELTVR